MAQNIDIFRLVDESDEDVMKISSSFVVNFPSSRLPAMAKFGSMVKKPPRDLPRNEATLNEVYGGEGERFRDEEENLVGDAAYGNCHALLDRNQTSMLNFTCLREIQEEYEIPEDYAI